MNKTTQRRVADEVLQRPEIITIGGCVHKVAPPTVGTLIMVSEEISTLPELKLDMDNLINDVLREAKNCMAVGRAIAVLILGSKKIREARLTPAAEPTLWQKIKFGKKKYEVTEPDPVEALSFELLDNASPHELYEAMAKLVQRMQIGDFFGLTTFLNGINTTKPTREVES
ncbi:MAG: hypothetical protein ACSW8D_03175 [Prevotella sp.]